MEIRPYKAGDESGIQKTVKEVYDEFGFTWEEDGYHQDLFSINEFYPAPGQMFVAEVGEGKIVACGALQVYKAPFSGTSGLVFESEKWHVAGADCQLNRLYVRSEFRKLGLGSKLTQSIIDLAKTENLKRMEIWSDKLFVEAHKLYERFGAIVVGERICDDPDEAPEWGLSLDLN